MNKIGKIIRNLRQSAGFSQKTLANAIHVTDKAISKWERGICLPDVLLLPKLAAIFDADVELLISNSIAYDEWAGLIDICDCDFSQIIYDKPLIYYLLSHFLLLGITNVYVLSSDENKKYLDRECFKLFGFRFYYKIPVDRKLMIINYPWFLFGSNLSQQFQGAMLSCRNTKLIPENQEAIVCFSCDDIYFSDKEQFVKTASPRTLGRGMVCFDMGDDEMKLEVASFIRTYQKNSRLLIGSLEEIAYNRGIISGTQLLRLSDNVSYGELLREVTRK